MVPKQIDPDDFYGKRDIPLNSWDGFAANRLDRTKLEDNYLATIKDYNTIGVKPEYVMEAPIPGVKKLFKKMNLTIEDIDLVEHNEAFSSASVALIRSIEIPENIFNVHGGAVAIGHPIGSSGSRILVTLMHAMKRYNKKRGLATICLGGGNAVSMIIER